MRSQHNFRLPRQLVRRAELLGKAQGLSVTFLIEQALETLLAREEPMTTFDPTAWPERTLEGVAVHRQAAETSLREVALQMRAGEASAAKLQSAAAELLEALADSGDATALQHLSRAILKLADGELAGAFHGLCYVAGLDGAALCFPEVTR